MPKTRTTGQEPSESPADRPWGWLVAIVLLTAGLRLFRLDLHSLWQDEVWILLKSEYLKGVVTEGLFTSNHPPLMPVIVWLWRLFLPDAWEHDWVLRIAPVLLGLGGVVAVFFCARRFFDTRTGLVAALLMAISPPLILASRELKDYILLPMTGTLAVYALYNAGERNCKRDWALYAVLAAAACYSGLFAGPLLVAANLWFLLTVRGRRDRIKGWFVANIAGALLFVPQLGIMLTRMNAILLESTDWWIPKPTPWSVLFYLKTLAFGYSNLEPWFQIALLFYLLLFATGTWTALRHRTRVGLLCLMWFAVPIALLYAVSLVGQSAFLIRMMLPCAPAFYILTAYGATRPGTNWVRAGLIAVFAVFALLPLSQYYQGIYPIHEFPHRPGVHPPYGYRDATAFIQEHIQPNDIILHPDTPAWLPVYWYGIREHRQFTVSIDHEFIDYIDAANPLVNLPEHFQSIRPSLLAPVVEGRDRVWYVFSAWERAFLPNEPSNCWRWLDAHMTEVMHERFPNVDVFLYEPRTGPRAVRAVRRDEDDGVSARITHVGARAGDYRKVQPDRGLIPRPVAQRRGRLMLRFDGEPFEDSDLCRYSIVNDSSDSVLADVCVIPSQYLLEFAAFDKADPATPLWRVYPLFHGPPGPTFYEMPVLSARVSGVGTAQALGRLECDAGRYAVSLFLRGDIGRAPWPTLELMANGRDLLAPLKEATLEPGEWHWAKAGTASLGQDTTVTLTVEGIEDRGFQEADLAYMALSPPHEAGVGIQPMKPGTVEVAPAQTRSFEAKLPRWADRVDIWVFERSPDGKAYRIFSTRP